MTSSKPMLVSIKSDWGVIVDEPVVGKDVLELLSSSMYVNPLSIYREYVQNSADSIEEARALGALAPAEGRVDIWIDSQKRNLRIRDNGTGIGRAAFVKTMISLGASRKRGSKARGFRGVGRLAGLGYCQELTFRSRADGENEISELVWDCRRLRAALRDLSFSGSVASLIKDIVRVRKYVSPELPSRFFEVELKDIVRHGDDSLINTEQVREYLSQVAPIPFAPDFSFARHIQDELHEKVTLGNILIYLNSEKNPVYRPFLNTFEARKGVVDRFCDIRFFDVKGDGGSLAATGWILHHGYRGAIDSKASIKGLRLRSGNMQVGERNILDELFAEPRFNSWSCGEIHVLDARILPNGRRDHFEQSVHFKDLLNKLSPLAIELTHRCRVSSIKRNVIRQFTMAQEQVKHLASVIRQGAMGSDERARITKELNDQLQRMEKACHHSALDARERERMKALSYATRSRMGKVLEGGGEHRRLQALKGREKQIVTKLFSLLYDCSPNKQVAKLLIDRILARM